MNEKTSKCRAIVGFYKHTHSMYKNETLLSKFWTKMIVFWTRSKYTHCSIQLVKDKDNDLMLFAIVGKAAALVNTETLIRWMGPPDKEIDIGEVTMDWSKVEVLVDGTYQGTVRETLLWFFLTRFLSSWKPKTCTTCVCDILNAGGIEVSMHVSPSELLKELNHEFNYDSRKS